MLISEEGEQGCARSKDNAAFFRHRFCTECGKANLSLPDVKAISGIRGTDVLLEYYTHETSEARRKLLSQRGYNDIMSLIFDYFGGAVNAPLCFAIQQVKRWYGFAETRLELRIGEIDG